MPSPGGTSSAERPCVIPVDSTEQPPSSRRTGLRSHELGCILGVRRFLSTGGCASIHAEEQRLSEAVKVLTAGSKPKREHVCFVSEVEGAEGADMFCIVDSTGILEDRTSVRHETFDEVLAQVEDSFNRFRGPITKIGITLMDQQSVSMNVKNTEMRKCVEESRGAFDPEDIAMAN